MRKELARFLRGCARRLHDPDHLERVEVIDEYDICRCRLRVVTDDSIHTVEATLIQLPEGWRFEERIEE